MNCRDCENLQDDYLIRIIDSPAESFMGMEESHFEEVFHCDYNGITSRTLADLKTGTCKYKK